MSAKQRADETKESSKPQKKHTGKGIFLFILLILVGIALWYFFF